MSYIRIRDSRLLTIISVIKRNRQILWLAQLRRSVSLVVVFKRNLYLSSKMNSRRLNKSQAYQYFSPKLPIISLAFYVLWVWVSRTLSDLIFHLWPLPNRNHQCPSPSPSQSGLQRLKLLLDCSHTKWYIVMAHLRTQDSARRCSLPSRVRLAAWFAIRYHLPS